jgi:hypothetical protein
VWAGGSGKAGATRAETVAHGGAQWPRGGKGAGLSGRTARKGPLIDPPGDQTGGSFLVTNKLMGGRPPGPRRDCAVLWKVSENGGRGKIKFLNKPE